MPLAGGMQDALHDEGAALSDERKKYLKKWERLISVEEEHASVGARVALSPFWSVVPHDATATRCMSGLRFESVSVIPSGFEYCFVAAADEARVGPESAPSIRANDQVAISTDAGDFDLVRGKLVELSRNGALVVQTRARLKPPGMSYAAREATGTELQAALRCVVWRLDKVEYGVSAAAARANIYRLLGSRPNDQRLAGLIVDKIPPTFREPMQLDGGVTSTLNAEQAAAVRHILAADDYALVQGTPGSGKTAMITVLVEHLVAAGKKVLLSAYTNSAVDNLLLRLAHNNRVRFLRLGPRDSIHKKIQDFTFEAYAPEQGRTLEQVHQLMKGMPVVAVTCSSCDHKLLTSKEPAFDYCIVDEASQVQHPICLGPIRLAKKFVLVGDHHQLAPLVQSKKAYGLSISLFKELESKHPSAMVEMATQYRMNDDIITIPNLLVYSNKLRCADEQEPPFHRRLYLFIDGHRDTSAMSDGLYDP